MDEIEISSCSFSDDLDDTLIDQPMEDPDIQNLQLENSRLLEINTQLQSSIEGLKNQLNEALNAVNATKSISTQLQALKSQLSDANAKNAQLTQQINEITADGADSLNKTLQQVTALESERDQLNTEVQTLTEQRNRLRSDKQALKMELDEKSIAIEGLYDKLEKSKDYKKKLQAKITEFAITVSLLQEQIDKSNSTAQQDENEKSNLKQDIDTFKIKIGEQNKTIEDLKSDINSLKQEIATKDAAIAQIEEQYENQSVEIENMTKEKQKIILLLQKQSSALSAAEIRIESLQKENQMMSVKNQQKNARSCTNADILELKIPFEGEIGTNCENMLKQTQFQPVQRVQMVLNDTASYIAHLEEELCNIKKNHDVALKEIENAIDNSELWRQIVDAISSDMKQLIINGSLDSDKITNDEFVDYITKKCSEIDPLIKERVMGDQHFISNDFFFSDDITKKKIEIQTISDQSATSFAILTAQFLSNCALRQQISKLQQQSNANAQEVVERSLPTQDVSNAVSAYDDGQMTFQELQEKLNKASKTANALKNQLRKSQNAQMELQKADHEQKQQIAQLQIQNDNLKSELDVLNMKLQVAQNDLINNSQQQNPEILEQMKENEEKLKNEIKKLQEDVRNKTEECSSLSMLLKKTQIEQTSALLSKNKQIKRQEESFKREIENLNDQIAAIAQESEDKKKRQRKKERQAEQQHQQQIKEMQQKYEADKQMLSQTIETLKEKSNSANSISQKVLEQMSQVEQQNQSLKSENSQLVSSMKKIQSEMTHIKNQVAKEKQQITGQMAAQNMVYEMKIQKAVKEANEAADVKVKKILEFVQKTLGGVYDMNEELNVEAFYHILELAKSDLDKLSYFQSEAIKLGSDKI